MLSGYWRGGILGWIKYKGNFRGVDCWILWQRRGLWLGCSEGGVGMEYRDRWWIVDVDVDVEGVVDREGGQMSKCKV